MTTPTRHPVVLVVATALVLSAGPARAVPRTVRLPSPSRRSDRDAPGWNLARPLALLAVGGIVAAATWDEADPDAMSRGLENASLVDPFADLGNTYGNGLFIGGGSATVLAVGALSGNRGLQALGTDLCRSFVASALVTGVIKFGVDRKRPSGGGLSFPSGHTSTAFATVPVIAHHLGWQAGLVTGLIATHTGLGRMEDRKHFLSDVVFGAAIGLAVGDLVVQYRSHSSWLAGLVVTPESVGYTVRF